MESFIAKLFIIIKIYLKMINFKEMKLIYLKKNEFIKLL